MGGEINSIAAKLAGRIGEALAKTDREGRFYLYFNSTSENTRSESK